MTPRRPPPRRPPPTRPPPRPLPPQAAAGKTFTQDDVNRILAEDRRKHQAQLKEEAEKLDRTCSRAARA